MIELKNITKEYVTSTISVTALKDINLTFRESEFVSILGPSGGGKTTLLNIIGGLDKYTSGDLVINSRSTKKFNDRDWDAYRNHSVGFVFQNYNLISHQSVLANVELALTLSGVSRAERKKRAVAALESVGLGEQIKKKPNQLSGGQMQRVAIARALVNDPAILLADEPTGALDTKTSVSVMEILKKVASDRLVVMVTHNPKLAEDYSTRIINIMDGSIVGDSNPYKAAEDEKPDKTKRDKRINMDFMTALTLSLNNLLTKRGRTLLTAFAGSIGIIGIALILALSTGVNNYIARVQEETLSSYPLTIENSSVDLTSMMASMMGNIESAGGEEGSVKETQIVTDMFSQIGTNDLKNFKKYLDENSEYLSRYVNSIKYTYGITPQIYKDDTSNGCLRLNPSGMLNSYARAMAASFSSGALFSEMIDNQSLLNEQYDVVSGRWPENYNEVILVLENKDTISDYLLYSLGLKDQEEFKTMMEDAMDGEFTSSVSPSTSFTYEDLLSLKFKLVLSADYYRYNSEYDIWEDMRDDEAYVKNIVDNAETISIVGIVCPKEGAVASSLSMGIAYTPELTQHIIKTSSEKAIVISQLNDSKKDVFSGKTFDEINDGDNGSGLDFSNMIKVDTDALSSAFGMKLDENALRTTIANRIASMMTNVTTDTDAAQSSFEDAYVQLFVGAINKKINGGSFCVITSADAASCISEYLATEEAKSIITGLSESYHIPESVFEQIFTNTLTSTLSSLVQSMGGSATIDETAAKNTAEAALATPLMQATSEQMAKTMTETLIKVNISSIASQMATEVMMQTASSFQVDTNAFAAAFSFGLDENELNRLISTMMTSSDNVGSPEGNLRRLGYAKTDEPSSIWVYLVDFESKNIFKNFIADYNNKMSDEGKEENIINYTDITGILMSSVTSIVNTVSYVLIAFVSVSLVVSSIMIGIITYISVLERTKEIGLLRAMGASKRDISHVFNAETFIIGLTSGCIGIGVTLLLLIQINVLLRSLTGIASIGAVLPVSAGIILVIISFILTLIAGVIPSRMAAKKDPVIALRTE